MGVFVDFPAYEDLSDAPPNDAIAAAIAATFSEVVGKTISICTSAGATVAKRLLEEANNSKLLALCKLDLAVSFQENLRSVAAKLTNPTTIQYYQKLIETAEANVVAAQDDLARAAGVQMNAQRSNLAAIVTATIGKDAAAFWMERIGRLSGPAWTVVKRAWRRRFVVWRGGQRHPGWRRRERPPGRCHGQQHLPLRPRRRTGRGDFPE